MCSVNGAKVKEPIQLAQGVGGLDGPSGAPVGTLSQALPQGFNLTALALFLQ